MVKTKRQLAAYWERVDRYRDGGKSVCACGHRGDGPGSSHAARFAEGHGACTVQGCGCQQFQWDHWYADDASAEG